MNLTGCGKSPPAPQAVAREARDMRERRDAWTDWIPTSSRPSRESRSAILRAVLLLSQTCRPLKFCCAEMIFPQLQESGLAASLHRPRSWCRVERGRGRWTREGDYTEFV
jgi:hypothetical protein